MVNQYQSSQGGGSMLFEDMDEEKLVIGATNNCFLQVGNEEESKKKLGTKSDVSENEIADEHEIEDQDEDIEEESPNQNQ